MLFKEQREEIIKGGVRFFRSYYHRPINRHLGSTELNRFWVRIPDQNASSSGVIDPDYEILLQRIAVVLHEWLSKAIDSGLA